MVDVPAPVLWGTVTGRLIHLWADLGDEGDTPDALLATGTVTFTPVAAVVRGVETSPKFIGIKKEIVCPVVEGWLCRPGTPTTGTPPEEAKGIRLVASDSPGIQPSRLQWQVTFKINGAVVQPPSVPIEVFSGQVLDLSEVVPSDTPGVITVVTEETRLAAEAAATSALEASTLSADSAIAAEASRQGAASSAYDASLARTGAVNAATSAEASALEASTSATEAAASALAASQRVTEATSQASAAESSKTAAVAAQSASEAAAGAAAGSAAAAEDSRIATEAVQFTATATGLPAGSAPTATVSGVAPDLEISFGVPEGAPGPTVVSEDPGNSAVLGTDSKIFVPTQSWETIPSKPVVVAEGETKEQARGKIDAAPIGHTHVSTEVTDFAEAVQDAVAAMLVSGANVTLTYDDALGKVTVTAAGGDAEVMRDTIGAALVGTNGVNVAVNDAADTITISVSGLTVSQVTGLQDALDSRFTEAEADARYVRTVNGTAPDASGNVEVAGGSSALIVDASDGEGVTLTLAEDSNITAIEDAEGVTLITA